MFKRLSEPSGQVANTEPNSDDSENKIVRQAILVHGGSDGTAMTFMSGDGEISFDENRIKTVINNHNDKILTLAKEYGGLDKMPLGAFPPILDQHSNESNNSIIGRLSSLLKYEIRDVPKVGKQVPCAIADITFLGKDTVERVKDGRIYHLSIGIDEISNTLGETSVVIEPAAPGAMLLSKQKTKQNNLKGENKMSKLMELSAMKKAKLTIMKENIASLTTKLEGTRNQIKLTAKKDELRQKLGGLMRSFKLSAAEFKRMDLTKLAALPQDAINTLMDTYETRSPMEHSHQYGSSDGIEFNEIKKNLEQTQIKRLKGEIRSDFKKLGKNLAEKVEDGFEYMNKKHMDAMPMNPGKNDHAVPGQAGYEKQMAFKKHMSDLKMGIDKHDMASVKMAHEKMMSHMDEHGMKEMMGDDEMKDMAGPAVGDVKSEDYKKNNNSIQMQIDELNTQMARMAGMVEDLMSMESQESEHMGMKQEGMPMDKHMGMPNEKEMQ